MVYPIFHGLYTEQSNQLINLIGQYIFLVSPKFIINVYFQTYRLLSMALLKAIDNNEKNVYTHVGAFDCRVSTLLENVSQGC